VKSSAHFSPQYVLNSPTAGSFSALPTAQGHVTMEGHVTMRRATRHYAPCDTSLCAVRT